MKAKAGVRCSTTSASGESSAQTQSVTSPQSITGQRQACVGSGLAAWRRLAAGCLAAGAAAAGAAALGGRLLAGEARVRFLGADGALSGVAAPACPRAGEVRRALGADGARAGSAPRALAGDFRARCFDGAEGWLRALRGAGAAGPAIVWGQNTRPWSGVRRRVADRVVNKQRPIHRHRGASEPVKIG